MSGKRTYDDVVKIFSDNNCLLQTTKEEYDEMKKPSGRKFKFVAACGHDNTTTLMHFVREKTGMFCKPCMREKFRVKMIERNKCDDKISSVGNMLEKVSFDAMREILCEDFDVMWTNRGCSADFIVRAKNVNTNAWLGVQLKATQKMNQLACGHIFNLNGNRYENMVILFHCVSDSLMWLVPFDAIVRSGSIIMGTTEKSRYFEYRICKTDLSPALLKYFGVMKLDTSENFMVPKSRTNKIEHKYRTIRETCCDFLHFVNTETEGSYYDFAVNGKNVKERVAGFDHTKPESFIVFLTRGLGNINYANGMNDFYWFNISNMDIFYVIPENVMIENGFIDSGKNTKLKKYFRICLRSRDNWRSKYQFDYKNLDREKLSTLIDTGHL